MPSDDKVSRKASTDGTGAAGAQPVPQKAAPKPPKIPRKPPEDWARETGQIQPLRVAVAMGTARPDMRSAAHRAASMAHGWEARRYRNEDPVRLTREDYLAALKAAQGSDARGRVRTHAPALCPEFRKAD